jgi:hypothetical protein
MRIECLLAIKDRRNNLDWYVLHYNTKTTEYMNEIEFMNYDDALEKFINEKPYSSDDRVELIFSPTEDDETYENNLVIDTKCLENKKIYFEDDIVNIKITYYELKCLIENLEVDEEILLEIVENDPTAYHKTLLQLLEKFRSI